MTRTALRVCHVISADLWAGAAVQVFHTICDLRRRGVEVAAVLFNDGTMATRLLREGVSSNVLDETRLSAARIALGVAGVLRKTKPHCVHVHAYKEQLITAAARLLAGQVSVPVVRTVHGRISFRSDLKGYRRAKTTAIEFLERRLLNRSCLIAVSQDIQHTLASAHPGARIELIPNGIRLSIDAVEGVAERSRWGVPQDAYWVGTVARLEPVKNLSCLIRAAALLRATVPNLRVSIFGSGSQHDRLCALISDLDLSGIVTLHGFEPEAAAVTASFDSFVLPSSHEGLPMSLLEAMWSGVPVVCTRVGGMAELVTDRETGLLVQPGDPAALSAALRELWESRSLARTLGQAGQELVRRCYGIEVTNRKLLEVYESLTGQSPA